MSPLLFITDDVEAFNEVWIVGDDFLKDCANTMKSRKRSTQTAPLFKSGQQVTTNKYLLHQNYNVKIFYAGSGVRGANRFIYPLVEALNNNHKLPQYIIIIPDKDMISVFKGNKFHTGIVMGSTIHYILRQYEMYIECRCQDLGDKKPSALSLPEMPHFIWVRMLKRPSAETGHQVFSLRGKFNSVLEEQLLNGKDSRHRIMSINIRADEFNLQGNLTSSGKFDFWHEIDKAMKKYVAGAIKLLPHKFQHINPAAMNQTNSNNTTSQSRRGPDDNLDILHRIAEVHKRHTHLHSRRRLWSPRHHAQRTPTHRH